MIRSTKKKGPGILLVPRDSPFAGVTKRRQAEPTRRGTRIRHVGREQDILREPRGRPPLAPDAPRSRGRPRVSGGRGRAVPHRARGLSVAGGQLALLAA